MAVTLTVQQLAIAIRAESTDPAVTRLLGVATEVVQKYAPDAPDIMHNEAATMLSGYLYDKPSVSQGHGFAKALTNSGAASLLLPYRVHRAGSVGEAVGEVMRSALEGNPVTNISIDGSTLTVTFLDGTSRELELPDGGGPGVGNPVTNIDISGRDMTVTFQDGTTKALTLPAGGTSGSAFDDTAILNRLNTIESDDWVTGRRIRAEAVATGHIADDAVTGAKIPRDAIDQEHLSSDSVGESELRSDAVGTIEIQDNAITESKLSPAVRSKLGASTPGRRGDDAYSWAEEGNTAVIPKAKIPHYITVYPSMNPATIQSNVSGEKNQDIVVGYSATEVGVFRFSTSANAFQLVVKWPRVTPETGRSDSDLETFIERIVESWAISGNADGIPGSKTFDGLFKAESQTGIPAANTTIAFGVGTGSGEVDETDAEDTSFVITSQQANQAGAFLRCNYELTGITRTGFAPLDVELILQNADTGATISKHNIKDSGGGHAQFAIGDAGRKRWAIRVVTRGVFNGNVVITNTEYHSAEALVEPAIRSFVAPEIHDEAEKRQEQDKFLRDEIDRVEEIKAIVNGLPSATTSVKKSIAWQASRPYEQTEADAFQVPDTGFVSFIVGNLGTTAILPVSYCRNRGEIIYAVADVEVGIRFTATGRALLYAKKGSALWESHAEAYNTTNGFVMLHWDTARKGGASEGGGVGLELTTLRSGAASYGMRGTQPPYDIGFEWPADKDLIAVTVRRESGDLNNQVYIIPNPRLRKSLADTTPTKPFDPNNRASVGDVDTYVTLEIIPTHQSASSELELYFARTSDNRAIMAQGTSLHTQSGNFISLSLLDMVAIGSDGGSGGGATVASGEFITVEPGFLIKSTTGLQVPLTVVMHGIPATAREGATKLTVNVQGVLFEDLPWNPKTPSDRVQHLTLSSSQAASVKDLQSLDHINVMVSFFDADSEEVGDPLGYNIPFISRAALEAMDPDKVNNQRSGAPDVKFWTGTRTQYNAATKSADTLYFITN